MINCAHPSHFEAALPAGDARCRIHALRANASMRSHAELDAAEDLDAGDPDRSARNVTSRSAANYPSFMYSAAAAERTSITSPRSATPGWPRTSL